MNAQKNTWKTESSLPSYITVGVFRPPRHPDRRQMTMTLENAERGVTVNVGEAFELDLGVTEWRLRVRDKGLLVHEGCGTWRALARGRTRIYATSEPTASNPDSPNLSRKLLIEIPVTVL